MIPTFIVKLIPRQLILKGEKANHTTSIWGMKSNGKTAFIPPFNKYLLYSFEVTGDIQGIGNRNVKETVLGLRSSGVCEQTDTEQCEPFII